MKKEQFTDKLLAANGLIREERLGKPQLVLILVASLLVLLSPSLLSSYRLNLVVSILSAAYLAQCWSLMSGFAGQFSFGHAAFYGLGAYTSSMLYTDFGITPWVGMLFGMLVAGLVAALIGVLSFRYKLRGDYFALATLAFAEMLRIIFNNTEFLHAAQGVMITYKKDWRVMQFSGKAGYVYMAFIMLAVITFALYRLRRSKTGLYFVAIRENEDAAQALGINAFRYKMLALVASAMCTALAGTFYAQYYKFIDPSLVFGSSVSTNALLPCILGGMGTVFGPILGAVIVEPISELTNAYLSAFTGMNMVVYGVILVAVVILLPKGVGGLLNDLSRKLTGRKAVVLKEEVSQG